jgi:hypothetical protein
MDARGAQAALSEVYEEPCNGRAVKGGGTVTGLGLELDKPGAVDAHRRLGAAADLFTEQERFGESPERLPGTRVSLCLMCGSRWVGILR